MNIDLSSMTLEQFQQRFSSEDACAEALFQARWPDGFRCPRCAYSHAYFLRSRRHYQCAHCAYQASLTAGTVFENTRTPLTKWFLAIFFMSRPEGIRATTFQRAANVTYKTAWTILMKLRTAMQQSDEKQQLKGNVRLNASIYGKKIQVGSYLVLGEIPVILGASCDEVDRPEQIKIKLIPEKYANRGYFDRLTSLFFQERYVASDANVRCKLLKRRLPFYMDLRKMVTRAQLWIYRTFIAISERHLQRYLDEFCFRYNHGDEAYRQIVHEYAHLPPEIYLRGGDNPIKDKTNNISEAANVPIFQALLKLCATSPAITYRRITRLSFYRRRIFTECRYPHAYHGA